MVTLPFGCRKGSYYEVPQRGIYVQGSLQIGVLLRCKNENVTLSQRFDNVVWLVGLPLRSLSFVLPVWRRRIISIEMVILDTLKWWQRPVESLQP
jgi:hypothetical protein